MKNPTLYREIFEPETAAFAPRFADRAMMITREGEIRVYGCRPHEHENGSKNAVFVMLRSNDNGLSYTIEEIPEDDPGARVASPWSDDYFTMISHLHEVGNSGAHCRESHVPGAVQLQPGLTGTWLYRSVGGPDGPWEKTKICDEIIHLQRLPLPLKKWKRWINAGQKRMEDGRLHPVVLLGDHEGKNWTVTVLPAPPVLRSHTRTRVYAGSIRAWNRWSRKLLPENSSCCCVHQKMFITSVFLMTEV